MRCPSPTTTSTNPLAPLLAGLGVLLAGCAFGQELPEPPYVDPGPPGGPPADAVTLVDRFAPTLDPWRPDTTAGWKLDGKVLKAPAQGADLVTKQAFGDVQLHVEFRVTEEGQSLPRIKLLGTLAIPVIDGGSTVQPGNTDSAPPGDAVVLFDGTSLDGWTRIDGRPARWDVVKGILRCKPGTGNIITKERFRDVQLHVEFATPYMPQAKGQGRGNSGVYLQGRYEIQVLDSYQNKTYFDGQCGAIYHEYPPLVNVCRPPLQWQSYDIVFYAARCDANGKVTVYPRATVLHNGVVIHDNVEIHGPTGGHLDEKMCEPGPLMLQDHGNTVQFRNIWLRHLTGKGRVSQAPRSVGEWQSYDIVFRAPRLGQDGTVQRRARVTVFHNGVLLAHAVEIGPGKGAKVDRPAEGPVILPAGNVEYRNVWIRPIASPPK